MFQILKNTLVAEPEGMSKGYEIRRIRLLINQVIFCQLMVSAGCIMSNVGLL